MSEPRFLVALAAYGIGIGMSTITGSDRWFATFLVAGPITVWMGLRVLGGHRPEIERPRLFGAGTILIGVLATLIGVSAGAAMLVFASGVYRFRKAEDGLADDI